eukprot:TRINITY_DN22860_c0_g1_i1.p1 TRINITY_DN22860_c0_g1~~TRINITY_DN22860_c0_g1_i1.p1  ORF type:complete len:147 (-),score=41.47 TRINITY_DN22860_c0_g1_i1:48-431(-)
MDCEKVPTRSLPTPQTQRCAIRKVREEENEIKVNDTFYLVSAKWWNDWKDYVSWDIEDGYYSGKRKCTEMESGVIEPPSSIDNHDLLDDSLRVRAELLEGEDYILVGQRSWSMFKSWYELVSYQVQK